MVGTVTFGQQKAMNEVARHEAADIVTEKTFFAHYTLLGRVLCEMEVLAWMAK